MTTGCLLMHILVDFSETKLMDKIKLDPNIVQFAFFFSKSVSFPSDINSGHKILLPGPALSLPGTCIIASKDLHYCFRGPALLLPDLHFHLRTLIITSGTCIIASRPTLFLPDLHYFTVTFPSRNF